jgi:hypothetical protein
LHVTGRLQRIALVATMSVTAMNVWIGAPLIGLWVGSRLAGDAGISMGALAAFVVVTLAVGLGCVRLLAVLGERYERLSGVQRTVHRQLPWLRSMRGERPHDPSGSHPALTALDYVLVGVVMACVLAFEVWFPSRSASAASSSSPASSASAGWARRRPSQPP